MAIFHRRHLPGPTSFAVAICGQAYKNWFSSIIAEPIDSENQIYRKPPLHCNSKYHRSGASRNTPAVACRGAKAGPVGNDPPRHRPALAPQALAPGAPPGRGSDPRGGGDHLGGRRDSRNERGGLIYVPQCCFYEAIFFYLKFMDFAVIEI